jgi:hypothetical protein
MSPEFLSALVLALPGGWLIRKGHFGGLNVRSEMGREWSPTYIQKLLGDATLTAEFLIKMELDYVASLRMREC